MYWDTITDSVPAVDILDCQIQLTHSYAAFGSVASGFLLLSGMMREATWYVNRSEVMFQTSSECLSFISNRDALEATGTDGQTHFLGWVVPDALEKEWPQDLDFSISVWCLKIQERTEKRGTRCLFLLLAGNESESFRRIASFEIGDARYRYDPPIERDFFKNIKLKSIKIV